MPKLARFLWFPLKQIFKKEQGHRSPLSCKAGESASQKTLRSVFQGGPKVAPQFSSWFHCKTTKTQGYFLSKSRSAPRMQPESPCASQGSTLIDKSQERPVPRWTVWGCPFFLTEQVPKRQPLGPFTFQVGDGDVC